MSSLNNSQLGRSWVDLLTNKAFIQNLNTASLSNILLGQKFPEEIFFSFIHEATHHWCFNSYVGNCLFLVKMRAFLSAQKQLKLSQITTSILSDSDEGIDSNWDIYTDYIRFKSVQKVLEPITEGLALFAEFDSYPTETEAIPNHFVYISIMFSGINRHEFSENNISKYEKLYKDFLIRKRFEEEEAIYRKSELLVESTAVTSTPYLTGYLFIKNIQSILISVNEKFSDPNLFIQFIRAYYFNDLGLISIILDPSIKDDFVTPKIAEYFNQRTTKLTSLPPETIDEFEKNIISPKYVFNCWTIHTSQEIANQGHNRLNEGVAKFLDETDISVFLTWYMRSFFRVTQLECYVTITESNIKIEIRFPVEAEFDNTIKKFLKSGFATKRLNNIDVFTASFPNTEHCPNYEGVAIFEKYISFNDLSKEFEVFISDKCLRFSQFTGTWLKNEKDTVNLYFRTNSNMPEDAEIDDTIKSLLAKEESSSLTIEKFYNDTLFTRVHDYYESLALNCSAESLITVKSLMRKNGFWEILNQREDLLYLLSRISLLCSNHFRDRSEISNIIGNTSNIQELEDKLLFYGFRIFEATDDKIGTCGV